MTGIDRLRNLAGARDEWILGGTLAEIADEIERERECERDTIENLRLELGEAREAAAWVREHGGLERVKRLLDWVVGHCSTRQQLDFDFWLSGRVMHELGFDEDMADRDEVGRRLLARLMPEGMEWLVEAWPRYEDGKPLRIGDVVSDVEVRSVVFRDGGILLSDCTSVPGWGTWRSYKEPIKRPVADTWERLEEDAEKDPCDYFGFDGEETCGKCPASGKNCEQTMARDLVRRAKALSERDAS